MKMTTKCIQDVSFVKIILRRLKIQTSCNLWVTQLPINGAINFQLKKYVSLFNKAVVPIKIISNKADRKLTDVIMQIVKEGLPFSHVISDEYRRLTNTWYTRQDIALEINNRAEKIALNQFNRYPVVPDNANFMTRVQALLIWDGFMCTQHRHAYFFAVKIADYIHFVGLRYTEDTQNALWLATQVKDIIDTIEATKRVRVCAHVSDSANVCLAMHKILTGQVPETYEQHDKQELLQAKLSHPIIVFAMLCHQLFMITVLCII
ncbi:Conserved_hypothetical protein [Hexamita inflata]|uniref:Uncharacterized protein n=1 Tax=Hexamita inflata TaxID=28002 RepID=A0ABP1GUG5_9EUKA